MKIGVWQRGDSSWSYIDVKKVDQWLSARQNAKDILHSVELYDGSTDEPPTHSIVAFDFDGSGAHHDVNKLSAHLTQEEIQHDIIFSGSKGFHVTLGVAPASNHLGVKLWALELGDELGLSTLDKKIYARRHMLRVPGSLHSKGSRAGSVDYPAAHVSQYADLSASPSMLRRLEPISNTILLDDLIEAEGRAEAALAEAEATAPSVVRRSGLPACMRFLDRKGLCKPSTRNDATVACLTFLKLNGWSKRDAVEWTYQMLCRSDNVSSSDKEIRKGCSETSDWVWSKPDAFFSCGNMRSLGTSTKEIDCEYGLCGYVEHEHEFDGIEKAAATEEVVAAATPSPPNQSPMKASEKETKRIASIELLSNPKSSGINLDFEGSISVVHPSKISIPKSIKVKCNKDAGKPCDGCKIEPGKEVATKVGHTTLELALMLKGRKLHRALAGVPEKCSTSQVYTSKEHMAIQQCLIESNYDTTDNSQVSNDKLRAFAFFDRSMSSTTIKGKAFGFPDPSTNYHTHCITQVSRLNLRHEDFDNSNGAVNHIKRFRLDENPKKALELLHDNLADSYHRIYGRRIHSILMSLTWTSALSFFFRGKRVQRGWLQCLAFGDTGQGKTELAQAFRRLFAIGSIVNGENISTAGLSVGAVKIGNEFAAKIGEFARRDKQLVIVDEFHGASEEVVSGLSEVMDSGIAKMDKIAEARMMARCRKLFLANCINVRGNSVNVNARPYGCEHIRAIMRTPEDVRRIDYAVCFKRNEETDNLISSQGNSRAMMVPEESWQRLVDWVWSRNENQIIFEDCEEYIVSRAMKMDDDFNTSQVPIFVRGDAPVKLARICVAVAGATGSCDSKYNLVVTKRHVDAAVDLLSEHYESSDMAMRDFKLQSPDSVDVTDEFIRKVNKQIISCFGGTFQFEFYDFLRQVGTAPFRYGALIDYSDFQGSDSDVKAALRVMFKERLLRMNSGSYSINDKGTVVINRLWEDSQTAKRGGRFKLIELGDESEDLPF